MVHSPLKTWPSSAIERSSDGATGFCLAPESSPLRGVTVMQVREGKAMEALGYAKSGDPAIGQALEKATTG